MVAAEMAGSARTLPATPAPPLRQKSERPRAPRSWHRSLCRRFLAPLHSLVVRRTLPCSAAGRSPVRCNTMLDGILPTSYQRSAERTIEHDRLKFVAIEIKHRAECDETT